MPDYLTRKLDNRFSQCFSLMADINNMYNFHEICNFKDVIFDFKIYFLFIL